MVKHFTLLAAGGAIALFLAMVLFFELGRRVGKLAIAKIGDSARAGVGGIDRSVYGLLALLIGFTFAGAMSRFDHRRELIINEVNAIGTAWLRIELLPAERQPEIRESFRRYMDQLITVYRAPAFTPEVDRERALLARAEADLWRRAVAACLDPEGEKARMLLLPNLNETFDTVDAERLWRRMHPPAVIYALLAFSALMAALFGGNYMANAPRRNWLIIIGVSMTISIAVYLILELEAPRAGLVRIDPFDKALLELRATMN